MPFLRLPRLRLRRLCLYAFLTTLFAILAAIIAFTLYVGLPMRRAYYVETTYVRRLAHPGRDPSTWVHPLIEDAPQVFTWPTPTPWAHSETWDSLLGLNYDGTAKGLAAGTRMWIYLAGTAHPAKERPGAFQHQWKTPDCDDPAKICDAYIDAFRNITKYWRNLSAVGPLSWIDTQKALLRWVDCDVSPVLCSPFWGLGGANLLMHMDIGSKCDYTMIPTGSCPVTWRWIGLPIYQAPWTRQIRIPLDAGGSTVVSAFPSEEEQLLSIMAYQGALEAMPFDDEESFPPSWNAKVSVTPQVEAGPVVDTKAFPPLSMWGLHRSTVDNPWALDVWPYEDEIRCYADRYLDVLLGWWDNASHLVKPRECHGIGACMARTREQRWDYLVGLVENGEEYLEDEDEPIDIFGDRGFVRRRLSVPEGIKSHAENMQLGIGPDWRRAW